jgi:choline kinase
VECPKILLEFGGLTLLERHVRLLAKNGISRVFVVTGHRRERIAETLPEISRRAGIPVIEVFNPAFTEGSVLSVHISIPWLRASRGTVLVMDGDVLYDQRMLERLLESKDRSALLLDRTYSTDDDDPVLVPVRSGRPFEFRKGWRGQADLVGESIGFFKMHPEELEALIQDTCARAEGSGRGVSYDEAIRTLVKADRLGYVDVTGLPWTEVDFETDIDYGRDTILPQLLKLPAARCNVAPRISGSWNSTATVPTVPAPVPAPAVAAAAAAAKRRSRAAAIPRKGR